MPTGWRRFLEYDVTVHPPNLTACGVSNVDRRMLVYDHANPSPGMPHQIRLVGRDV